MKAVLVHHAEAVMPYEDPQRPLTTRGRAQAEWLAEQAKAAQLVPAAIWHSGKLRARQTAEAFYRRCAPFAEFKMMRGLLPEDPPMHFRNLIAGETRDILAAGHMPSIREILREFLPAAEALPMNGMVALETRDEGAAWTETWRMDTLLHHL